MSNRMEALQRERDSFVVYERRIMKERDEILANVRNRISDLDNEIIKLGGNLPPVQNGEATAPIILSVAPYPPVKKGRGRPRKSDQSTDNELTRAPTTEEKRRGRPKTKAEEAISPLTSIATSLISLRNSGSDPNVVAVTETASSEEETAGDWLCPCGLFIDGSKVRCGTCKKWKGGKRDKKWSFKRKKDADDVVAKKAVAKKRRPRAARLMYGKLKLKEVDVVRCEELSGVVVDHVRPEVESVLSQMLTAISEAGKKKRKRNSDCTADRSEKKRKPDRFKKSAEDRKVSVVTVEDSRDKSLVEEPAASATPFAFESLCHIVNMHINDEDLQAV